MATLMFLCSSESNIPGGPLIHFTKSKLKMMDSVARPELKQLTSEVRDGHTKKQQDDKAIQELKTSQAQLMKEKSQAQSQLADKNREMTGLRFVSVEIRVV